MITDSFVTSLGPNVNALHGVVLSVRLDAAVYGQALSHKTSAPTLLFTTVLNARASNDVFVVEWRILVRHSHCK